MSWAVEARLVIRDRRSYYDRLVKGLADREVDTDVLEFLD